MYKRIPGFLELTDFGQFWQNQEISWENAVFLQEISWYLLSCFPARKCATLIMISCLVTPTTFLDTVLIALFLPNVVLTPNYWMEAKLGQLFEDRVRGESSFYFVCLPNDLKLDNTCDIDVLSKIVQCVWILNVTICVVEDKKNFVHIVLWKLLYTFSVILYLTC